MYTILTILFFCSYVNTTIWLKYDMMFFYSLKLNIEIITWQFMQRTCFQSQLHKGHKAEKHLQLAATYSGVLCEKVIKNYNWKRRTWEQSLPRSGQTFQVSMMGVKGKVWVYCWLNQLNSTKKNQNASEPKWQHICTSPPYLPLQARLHTKSDHSKRSTPPFLTLTNVD